MSGVSQTDWSWTPLLTDFDNDGYRDMVVTNGFPRDVTDHDFIMYKHDSKFEPPLQLLQKIPQIKLANYAFKNTGGVFFNDATAAWGLTTPSFSNAAAYADFDNDGDMDMVINNIDDEPFLYENTIAAKGDTASHYMQIKCIGSKQNTGGIGAWIDIYYDGDKHQAFENTPFRGYLSTNQNIAHFGLGKTKVLDSVVIRWPGNKKQKLTKVNTNQLLVVNESNAKDTFTWQAPVLTVPPLFKEVTNASGITHVATDIDFIDFNIQATLPHKLSEYFPALAVGDIDGNGLDDMIMGGSNAGPAMTFLQQANGKFVQKPLLDRGKPISQYSKDEGLLLFDANGDGNTDLYIASGGFRFEHENENYQDRLYINDGNGSFALDTSALPQNRTSKLCVRSMDFNNDGKPDLFVSGRVDPQFYPKPVSSFIFRNDTENGKVKFTDVTDEVAPGLKNIGMVCDALFTDFDNDDQTDLILTGEWMPVTFFKNEKGKFTNVTAASGVNNQPGWWNSIVAGDFRHTGRTDYIVGNVGLNTLYQASEQYPVYITAKDFDHTGGYVPITSLFLTDTKGQLQEFPADGRDDILERIPSLRKRYNTYRPFAEATINDIFPAPMMKDAQRLKATMLQSCLLRNEGNGKFTLVPLPKEAQVSVLNGMVADDFDGDGNLDVLINGNDYGTEVSIGRFDALNGLLLQGDGKGNFTPRSILQSGIYIPGNGKALVKLVSAAGNYLVAASQHKAPLKLFQLQQKIKPIRVSVNDRYAIIKYKNGSTEKKEFYCGSSFLSQSAGFIAANENMLTITIVSNSGKSRTMNF